MARLKKKAYYGKLNALCFKALDGALELAKNRENRFVEIEHWLLLLVERNDSDIHRIFNAYGVDLAKAKKALQTALGAFSAGASSAPDLSQRIDELIEKSFIFSSLVFDATAIRSGHVLMGLLDDQNLAAGLNRLSSEFAKINVDDLQQRFAEICAGSPEASTDAAPRGDAGTEGGAGADQSGAGAKTALAKYASDMTADARAGRIDAIVGRDDEIRQVIDILLRRRQNNPILTGEAGVGKTAVVEGFARRIADGDVPDKLKNVRLLSLDLGALAAGASMKGEFEKRLKQVVEEVRASPSPIVMFIDEAHTLIGAGGQAGTGDAANLLKPALARGELRTIAATTWSEYKKHIEKDPALTRRFQVVKVEEPSNENAIAMMRAVSPMLERHHGVQILDEALAAAVKLSRRYIADRQLPDKSVSVLDTACARAALSQQATPAKIEDVNRRIDRLHREREIREREERIGVAAADGRIEEIDAALETARAELAELAEQWRREREIVEETLRLRHEVAANAGDADAADDDASEGARSVDAAAQEDAAAAAEAARARLAVLHSDLKALQGREALVSPAVDEIAVSQVIAGWTGVPVGRMVNDDASVVVDLPSRLSERVVGQDAALEAISKRVMAARAGIADPNKPLGVFLLCGPSGVGKTETALALAERLYGGEQNLITINMSEFQERHTVSTLKGAPPGYVGYGEGGRLTEAVRRRPYSVVLLDEIEKAHQDVHEVFFQVFDKGAMEDGEGRLIDFKNTLILMTSNVGDETLTALAERGGADLETAQQALRDPLLAVFPPAFLGRLVVLPYYPLSDAVLLRVIESRLARIGERVAERYGASFHYDPAVCDLLRRRCVERESGGRAIDAILSNSLLPRLAETFLVRAQNDEPIKRVEISVEADDLSYAFA